MTYDLRVTISGLAMYVPDGDHTMHVLMPNADNHVHAHAEGGAAPGHEHHHTPGAGAGTPPAGEAGAGAAGAGAGATGSGGQPGAPATKEDPHFTRIFYDQAYENPRSTELSRTYVLRDFKGKVLDLRGLPSDEEIDPRLPGEIPSMEGLAERVPRELVADGAVDPRLSGRVTMDNGAMTDYVLGAPFDLDGRQQRITVRSEWTIRGIKAEEDVPADGALPAIRKGVLPALEGAGLPKLYPIGQTIRLMVFNATADEFPPHGPEYLGEADDDAHHFDVYYQVTPPLTPSKRPFPRKLAGKDVDVVPVEGGEVPDGERGIQGLSCPHAMALLQ